MTHPNADDLVGMNVGRGFTRRGRDAVGGTGGCHRVSELVVEIAQAAYQLHFIHATHDVPRESANAETFPSNDGSTCTPPSLECGIPASATATSARTSSAKKRTDQVSNVEMPDKKI